MNRFICIHGHFYQPPRENPWLEKIERQKSAAPFHDWNERVTEECYAPNAQAKILDAKGKAKYLVNNYAKISFNFGPTLLGWLSDHAATVYEAVLQADQESQKRFSGHGSALAQAYNHLILPLANTQDKVTQVTWGLRDFEFHFKRKPEGMWLPETAVDVNTLEVLAEHGIKFTILAPRQARKVRRIGHTTWHSVHEGSLDPQRAYLCELPSGKSIVIFFYDGAISQEIAFGGLLHNGETFAQRLTSHFPASQQEPRLMNIATDGESYGHHHQFGDMALSYCLKTIEENKEARLTIYGEFLEQCPPQYEVQIIGKSSWSCSHGVERWRANCGCNIGNNQQWHQKWRSPLRQALDELRDRINPRYEEKMRELGIDPWEIRNHYIDVLLNPSVESCQAFLKQHVKQDVSAELKTQIFALLEMQKFTMFMYTSCGWFFDDIAGIEATQILQYAARAIQLAEQTLNLKCEAPFLKQLIHAGCNLPNLKNGAEVYETLVRPKIQRHQTQLHV